MSHILMLESLHCLNIPLRGVYTSQIQQDENQNNCCDIPAHKLFVSHHYHYDQVNQQLYNGSTIFSFKSLKAENCPL